MVLINMTSRLSGIKISFGDIQMHYVFCQFDIHNTVSSAHSNLGCGFTTWCLLHPVFRLSSGCSLEYILSLLYWRHHVVTFSLWLCASDFTLRNVTVGRPSSHLGTWLPFFMSIKFQCSKAIFLQKIEDHSAAFWLPVMLFKLKVIQILDSTHTTCTFIDLHF